MLLEPHNYHAWNPSQRITEPSPGVFFVEGPASNWIIVRDDRGFILVDSGYPADTGHVIASIVHLDLNPADTAALLITHGHADHTGSAHFFSTTYGTPVLCSPEELAQVHGLVKHQVTFKQVLLRLWRPRVFRWMIHAIKAGSLHAKPTPAAEAWTAEKLLSLPGRPMSISVPGHTPGNSAILFPAAGAIATGDVFVTGHPLSAHTGPQMLDRMYHHEPGKVLAATSVLDAVDASVILPGHGPALRMPLAGALADLRR